MLVPTASPEVEVRVRPNLAAVEVAALRAEAELGAPPDWSTDAWPWSRRLEQHDVTRDALPIAASGMTALRDAHASMSAAGIGLIETLGGRPINESPIAPAFRIAVDAAIDRGAKAHQLALTRLASKAEQLGKEIAKATASPSDAFDKEIREYVRALPEEERYAFVVEQINAGDLRVLGAVAGAAPAYLGGFRGGDIASPARFAELRMVAAKKFAPVAADVSEVIAEMTGHLTKAAHSFAKRANVFLNPLLREPTPAEVKVRAQRAAATARFKAIANAGGAA